MIFRRNSVQGVFYFLIRSRISRLKKPYIPVYSRRNTYKIWGRNKVEKIKKDLVEAAKSLILLAGTTRLELATSGVTGPWSHSFLLSKIKYLQ